jgi:hypothetical protein
MTLVIIFGPPAVGKMTVGLALERLTGFRLFHNHMTVDPVIRLFPFESPAYRRLVQEFRRRIFEEFASSEEPGLIFTFCLGDGGRPGPSVRRQCSGDVQDVERRLISSSSRRHKPND